MAIAHIVVLLVGLASALRVANLAFEVLDLLCKVVAVAQRVSPLGIRVWR